MRDCALCSAAVAELAGMPGLLKQLDVEDFLRPKSGEDAPALPVSLLPRLGRAARDRQVRRRALIGSAVAVMAAAAASITIFVMGPGAAPVLPSATTVELSALQPTNVLAKVTFVDQKWGTRLDTKCSYVKGAYSQGPSATYSLWVTSKAGKASQVATWVATEGSTVNPTATTDLDENEIASVDIRSASGQVLLRKDVSLG
jgi:RNA polymerase sigma-70 factor (ECF subfamily)